jgi:hypothetical protein
MAALRFRDRALTPTPSIASEQDTPLKHLEAEVQVLKTRFESESAQSTQAKAATRNNNGHLRRINNQLYKQNGQVMDAIRQLCTFTTENHSCGTCHRTWNAKVFNPHFTTIALKCGMLQQKAMVQWPDALKSCGCGGLN